jgi:UDP-N-acetylglucosamine 2-epimerase
MKIVTIVGARPQFIKSAPVSKALRELGHIEIFVHTGQHYDDGMSAVFFRELEIPAPNVNLGVGSGSHGQQTGQMLIRIENVLLSEKPDMVLVYGDTNSTLAGALAAVKLHVPVAHVEAGLRSFNREMPEEHNRVISDHLSNLLFCPTQTAVKNLENEGITQGVNLVGDVMYDSILFNIQLAEKRFHILENLKLKPKNYALATVHRPENTDNHERLKSIFYAFEQISQDGLPVIIPLHPRTRQFLKNSKFGSQNSKLCFIDPVSYLDMLVLEKNAQVILTDSGGVQKEAYWFEIPCVTLRDETEWLETVESGWNVLAGSNYDRIINAVEKAHHGQQVRDAYGNGRASERIATLISSSLP